MELVIIDGLAKEALQLIQLFGMAKKFIAVIGGTGLLSKTNSNTVLGNVQFSVVWTEQQFHSPARNHASFMDFVIGVSIAEIDAFDTITCDETMEKGAMFCYTWQHFDGLSVPSRFKKE